MPMNQREMCYKKLCYTLQDQLSPQVSVIHTFDSSNICQCSWPELLTKVLWTLRYGALLSRRDLAEHLHLCVVDDFLPPFVQNRCLPLRQWNQSIQASRLRWLVELLQCHCLYTL